jgi:hypothetical protein
MSDIVSPDLQAIVGLLLAVSIASEIVKGVVPWLNDPRDDVVAEGRRRAALQVLAVAAGILTAYLASPLLAESLTHLTDHHLAILSVGLLASGGSAFWNAILTYLLQVKDLKKQEVRSLQSDVSQTTSDALPDLRIGGERVSSNECYNVEDK